MIAVGDFNNDSRLNIAVANFRTHNVGIFLGVGNRSFESQATISTATSRPIAIWIADFNNDTILDIVTANYGTQSVSIFYGYGNGNFSDPKTYSTGYDSLPLSMAIGDFNNDRYLDLAVANYGTDNIGIFFADGHDTFKNQMTLSTGFGSHSYSIAVGYSNDDILLDMAVANYETNKIGVFINSGSNTFANQATYSIDPSSPYCISAGDLNSDNRLDLVVTNYGTGNIGVFLGHGDGTFFISKIYSTGAFSTISFGIDDFNKDNRLDIAVVRNDTGDIDVFLDSFEGFLNQSAYSTGILPQSVVVGDFNNDN
jgi:hypothetical protein